VRWALGIVLIAACGGGSSSSSGPSETPAAGAGEPAESSAEARLYRSQLATCGPMCERVTECAVEGARASLSEQELAELNLEETAPAHTRQCEEDCGASRLSPRQITVIRECITGHAECDPYIDCLDQVKKGGG
jgi:hypothetical protein